MWKQKSAYMTTNMTDFEREIPAQMDSDSNEKQLSAIYDQL
jgi:hypothetical protein